MLRDELGFRGAVFSDDLGMGAALGVGGVAARINACLAAGCDVALACNEPCETMLAIARAIPVTGEVDRQRGQRLARMRPSS